LGKTVAVSFEEDSIKIVHASLKGNNLAIDKTEAVDYLEFDSYLQREKATEFVVTYDFKEAFHGLLDIPAVKSKYLEKIVESEVKKATSLKDISFVYTPVSEKVVESQKILEVFYFAINNEVLHDVVDRFYEFGKVVKAVYPTVFSAASMINIQTSGEANLGVLGAGRERLAFFSTKGTVYFIRNYESLEPEFSDYDIQNINMTINYCEQHIKLEPSSVLVLGNLSKSSSLSTVTTKPLACLSKADNIHCDREVFNEYILPVASFYASRSSNILNREFKNIYMLNNYLAYASRAFVVFAVICIGLIFFEMGNVMDRKSLIESEKNKNSDVEAIFTEYSEREDKVNRYVPAVKFLNTSVPGIRKLLIFFSRMDLKDIRFTYISATAKKNNLFSVVLKGKSLVDAYSSTQASLKNMVDELDNTDGVKVTDTTLELEKKTFRVEMDYH
jgi:hypothetical protein